MWKGRRTTQHLFECDGYMEIRRNIIIEDTPMKTLRRNNIKAVAEVLSEITEKRRIMEERKNPVAKKKSGSQGLSWVLNPRAIVYT